MKPCTSITQLILFVNDVTSIPIQMLLGYLIFNVFRKQIPCQIIFFYCLSSKYTTIGINTAIVICYITLFIFKTYVGRHEISLCQFYEMLLSISIQQLNQKLLGFISFTRIMYKRALRRSSDEDNFFFILAQILMFLKRFKRKYA